MKTIRLTIDAELVERVDAYVKQLGTTRSAFAREALREALRRLDEKELEEQHVAGYQREPVSPGEFDVPDADLAWDDRTCTVD